MQALEMVVLIVLITVIAGLIKQWLNIKAEQGLEPSSQHSQQIQQLEERVKVLEAIVTDDKFELKQKFANLHEKESL